ncbi:MAG TPA: diacylglycerol kinase family protein [Pedobacter sp.]|uniref:diacylglycerol kinase n=1 Tax=Pedobacter sp. TaxID=1411316 RepID=UPI002BF64AAF|nr:diacylglycerol kinase family protein [Pedobacter sp.]HMI01384.1 diacylglycerol kinase family protein [Pedobacter sp.]
MNKFLKSFGYSFSGIAYAFKMEWNFRFHLIALLLVILAGWFFELSLNDWLWISAAGGIVITAELFNTAIEVLVDLVSPEIHPKAKIVKDVASAAVLVSAITAFVIGLIIFIPKILMYAA